MKDYASRLYPALPNRSRASPPAYRPGERLKKVFEKVRIIFDYGHCGILRPAFE